MADVVLNFSDLRDLISVYQSNTTADGAGGFTSTQQKRFDILAKVKPNGRAKRDNLGQIIYQEAFTLLIRYEVGLIPNPTDLIQFNGSFCRILEIENIENRSKVLKLIIARK
jgi:hypothetical protein